MRLRYKNNSYQSLRCLICILASISSCDAFNAEASSSYFVKVAAGLFQSAEWLSGFVVGDSKSTTRPQRKVTLALVGLGRTGSTSVSAGLKKLGYAPIHDDELHEVSDIYGAMMDGSMTMDEVNVALGKRGFDAPMMSLPEYVQWAAMAPDVKVILTVRDKSKWAKSWLSIVPAGFLPNQRPLCWIKSIQELAAFRTKIMVDVPTNGHPELFDDIPTLEAGFEAWTAFVRKTVPPDKLLEFDVRKGWKPLCEFLGQPVPEGPFPHINDRVVMDVIVKAMFFLSWVWPLVIALPFVSLYFLVCLCILRWNAGDKNKHA